jgi:hypothetical protein
MNIDLHIDELVLHGVDPHDRWAIGDAVQRELVRLLGERGLTTVRESVDVPRLDAGSIALPAQSRGAAIGSPIASALHAALGGKR